MSSRLVGGERMQTTDDSEGEIDYDEIDGIQIRSTSMLSRIVTACRTGCTDDLRALLGSLGRRRVDLTKPLLEAIAWSKIECVTILLDAGASVTLKGSVDTPGGSGIRHSETRNISPLELAHMMRANHTRCGGRIAKVLDDALKSEEASSELEPDPEEAQRVPRTTRTRGSTPAELALAPARQALKRPRQEALPDELSAAPQPMPRRVMRKAAEQRSHEHAVTDLPNRQLSEASLADSGAGCIPFPEVPRRRRADPPRTAHANALPRPLTEAERIAALEASVKALRETVAEQNATLRRIYAAAAAAAATIAEPTL